MIDFTDCEIDITANYGGSDQKKGIIYNGDRYMLKMSDRINTEKRNILNSSYSNSVFSEYICCHILNETGLPAQDTLLGTIKTISQRTGEEKVTPVVACKNFIPKGYSLIEFKNIENALLFDKPGKIPKLSEINDILHNENAYFSKELGKAALERYWDTFVMDALLGNFDRHANNWGYIINNTTYEITLAPIYDCGSCLYPQISDDAIPQIITSEKEKNDRVYKFPNAALELNDGTKANYYNFMNSMNEPECTAAIKRTYPKINMKIIDDIIATTPGISEIRKRFYSIMIRERYDKILTPVYSKALNCNKDNINNEYECIDESFTMLSSRENVAKHKNIIR